LSSSGGGSGRIGFRILLITDGFDGETAGRVEAALAALPEGAAAVQLRAKGLGGAALFAAARKLAEVVKARRGLLVVNDRADVARAAGADGVHLPVRGLPVAVARRWLGAEAIVGASTHSLAEAEAAWRGGADYVTFGPLFATASKAAFGEPVGVGALAEAVRAAGGRAVFALGGIGDGARAAQVVALGARVACIGAVLGRTSVDEVAAGAREIDDAIG
jgi:thiamine-phosphate pyrophosphorylase